MKWAVLSLLFVLIAAPVYAADNADTKTPAQSAPRFAALRSGEVNMRTGPGTRYPIDWVYKHKGLPVEVIGEYEIWRRVRDSEGALGWVHKSALTSKRSGIVTGQRNLLGDSANDAKVVARLENGSIGQVLSCSKDWCRLKFDGIKGYLRKTEFWGAYPDETFN